MIFIFNTAHFLMEMSSHRKNAYSRTGDGPLSLSAVTMPERPSSIDNVSSLMHSTTYEILNDLYGRDKPLEQAELQQNQRWARYWLHKTPSEQEEKQKQFKRIFNANYFFEQSCIDTCIFFRKTPEVILEYMIINGYE